LTPLRVTRASINPFMLSHISVASMRIPFKVGANGVTANDLVSIDGNLDVIRANLNTNGTSIIGVTAQSGNQGDTVLVAISGLAQAVADGTINIGDRVSATNNNNNPGRAIRFTGTPSGQVIGKALTPTTAAGQPFGMLVSVSG